MEGNTLLLEFSLFQEIHHRYVDVVVFMLCVHAVCLSLDFIGDVIKFKL